MSALSSQRQRAVAAAVPGADSSARRPVATILETPSPRPSAATRLRLTPQGLLVLVITLALVLSGLVLQRQGVVDLGLAVAVGLGLASLLLLRGLRRINSRWLLPVRCHAGEATTIGLELCSPRLAPELCVLAVAPGGREPSLVAELPSFGPAPLRLAWPTRFPARGRHRVEPPTLRGSQPFGLLRADRRIGDGAEVLVWPMVGRLRHRAAAPLLQWLDGRGSAAALGSDEPDHLRPYRPGDPPRRIHQRASARARRLLVTERRSPEARRAVIVLDPAGAQANSRRWERLLAVAATLCLELSARGWELELRGACLGGGRAAGTLSQLLDSLALAGTATDADPLAVVPVELPALILTLRDHLDSPDARRCRILPAGTAASLIDWGREPSALVGPDGAVQKRSQTAGGPRAATVKPATRSSQRRKPA